MFGKGMAEAVAARAGGSGGTSSSGSSSSSSKASGKGSDEWIGIQRHTFTAWVNTQLEACGAEPVKSLEEDLKSGAKLIQMIEVVSKKPFGRYKKEPRLKAHMLENITAFLAFLQKEGLTLVNIGSGDVEEGNLKLILGLIWTIIYHYQISVAFREAAAKGGGRKPSAKDLLLKWVNEQIPEYEIKNFNKDWNDGAALAALVNAVGGDPHIFPNHTQMRGQNARMNAKRAIEAAEEELGIPDLLRPEDLVNPQLDDLSMMTYISYFRTATRQEKKSAIPARDVAPAPEPIGKVANNSDDTNATPPWERSADWRVYKGDNLGGRCKIRVYFSTTTSSVVIRKNTEALKLLLERHKYHERPDFEPWIPIDLDMNKETRDKIFKKSGSRVTPQLFIDDEFVGGYDDIVELNESGELAKIFEY